MNISLADWQARGRTLFGDDPTQWRFRCPICKHVQTAADFAAIGARVDHAYQSCIGREQPDCASGLGAVPAKDGSLSPCDYAAYGLFRAIDGHLVMADGVEVPVLPFDEVEGAGRLELPSSP